MFSYYFFRSLVTDSAVRTPDPHYYTRFFPGFQSKFLTKKTCFFSLSSSDSRVSLYTPVILCYDTCMKRQIDLSEISDGKLYQIDDLCRLGCSDCLGCSSCCHDTEGLILDPLDVARLVKASGRDFMSLIERELELSMVDEMLLPKMRMDQRNACHFLDANGRCSIHPDRPGICRLFPLGRYYENDDYRYFLQTLECRKHDRYKLRIRDWLDEKDAEAYHDYIMSWHRFLKLMEEKLPLLTEESRSSVTSYILKMFFLAPYQASEAPGSEFDTADFYSEYYARMFRVREALEVLGN